MHYRVTARTLELVGHLRCFIDSVRPLIDRASPAARHEWAIFQSTWPSDEQLGQETLAISDSALDAIHAKARRFREILQSLAPVSADAPRVSDHRSIGGDQPPLLADWPPSASTSGSPEASAV